MLLCVLSLQFLNNTRVAKSLMWRIVLLMCTDEKCLHLFMFISHYEMQFNGTDDLNQELPVRKLPQSSLAAVKIVISM